MIALLTAAAVYGLSAGFSPGPLLALVIAQTIRFGFREGARAAMAPLELIRLMNIPRRKTAAMGGAM